MRITNSMMIDNVLKDLNSGLLRLNKYQSQLASNRKMVKLSDSPVGVQASLTARAQIRQIKQYQKNITTARKWNQQAETSIMDMQETIKTIYENLIDAGGVKNPGDKDNIATLTKQLKQHLVDLCNSSTSSKYIFGGHNTTTQPFQYDENGVLRYNGIDLSDPAVVNGTFTSTATKDTNPNLTDPSLIKDFKWERASVYPVSEYTISLSGNPPGANYIRFTPPAGSNAQQVDIKIPDIKEGANEIDMREHGLGIITFNAEKTVLSGQPAIDKLGAELSKMDPPYGYKSGVYDSGTGKITYQSEIRYDVDPITGAKTPVPIHPTPLEVTVDDLIHNADGTTGAATISERNTYVDYSQIYVGTGRGMEKFDFGGELPTAEQLAQDIAASFTDIESTLYKVVTRPVSDQVTTTGSGTDTVSYTGATASFDWTGPITKQGKFYIEADMDRTVNPSVPTGGVTIRDERGIKVTNFDMDPAGDTLDLTSFGLGTLTYTAGGGATAGEMAQDLEKMRFITSATSEELSQHIRYEVGFEQKIDATFNGVQVVGLGSQNMFSILDDLIFDLERGAGADVLTKQISKLQGMESRLLTNVVELGSRTVRLDVLDNRYSLDFINAEQVRTDIEDIDPAYTIMQMKFMEAIYKQALAAGAQIIQPTLMDFLR